MPVHRIGLSRAWEHRAAQERPRWLRRFGRPADLDPDERISLVVEAAGPALSLVLNGEPLPDVPSGAARWTAEVTDRLLARNELVVTVHDADPAAWPPVDGGRPDRGCLPEGLGRFSLDIASQIA